jgi:hypothetical protein
LTARAEQAREISSFRLLEFELIFLVMTAQQC